MDVRKKVLSRAPAAEDGKRCATTCEVMDTDFSRVPFYTRNCKCFHSMGENATIIRLLRNFAICVRGKFPSSQCLSENYHISLKLWPVYEPGAWAICSGVP